MAESGQGYYFQNGIWLNRGETSRSDKFQKWTDEKKNSKVEQLDKQRHMALVRLNSECLQMRAQLRDLNDERRQFRRGSNRQGAPETEASVRQPVAPLPSATRPTGLNKSASSGPLGRPAVSAAVGKGAGQGPRGRGRGRPWAGAGAGAGAGHDMAGRMKSLHTSRNLSKLKNEMDVTWK